MTKRTPPRSKSGVGYGRPPVHARFKPGQSGNPRGRKKGSRNIASIIGSVFTQRVTIQVGGKTRKVPLMEAVVIRLAQDALKGNPKAVALSIKVAQSAHSPDEEIDQQSLTSDDQKLLTNFAARLLIKNGGKK